MTETTMAQMSSVLSNPRQKKFKTIMIIVETLSTYVIATTNSEKRKSGMLGQCRNLK